MDDTERKFKEKIRSTVVEGSSAWLTMEKYLGI
jgi:hypothetical protein